MSTILVYIEHQNGEVKKASLEALCYARELSTQLGSQKIVALVLGTANNLANLGNYGATTVLNDTNAAFNNAFEAQPYTKAVANAAQKTQATTLIFANTHNAKAIAPRLSVRLQAGYVSGVTQLPAADFSVSKSVFSGKGVAHFNILTATKILSVNANTLPITAKNNSEATLESFDSQVSSSDFKVKVQQVKKLSGAVPLTEADIVVSAGRGLKGPENWGMVEDLANVLHAATACSRPVADVGWRPHHEHVGQTGITVRPKLYFALGISGAIQHLAGVNNSKVIVVVNKDPEAPFFKAADYGIVGDVFDVIPKITKAIKELN